MKVLLLVPVKDSEDVFDAWAEHILRLEPKPWKTIFCENDSSDNTLECCNNFPLEKEVITFKMDPVDRNSPGWRYQSIGTARQKLLDRARELDPDFAIFLDVDILVKSQDLIEIFTTWDLDIVSGAYPGIFTQKGIFLAALWPAKTTKYELHARPRMVLDEVATAGGGCLCLSRKVVQDEKLNFMPLRSRSSEDFGYCLKARDLGYKVYLESLAMLVHETQQKALRPWYAEHVIDYRMTEVPVAVLSTMPFDHPILAPTESVVTTFLATFKWCDLPEMPKCLREMSPKNSDGH